MAKACVCVLLVFLMVLTTATAYTDTAEIRNIPLLETGRNPMSGQIINSLIGTGVDDTSLRGCLYLLPYATPWGNNQPNIRKLQSYINFSDRIVQTVARHVYVAEGIGLCDSRTGERVDITQTNDTLVWGCDDYYAPAGWTWYTGSGDCEDRSIAFYHILWPRGFQAMIVFYYCNESADLGVDIKKRSWHVVVQYKLSGKVWVSDFGRDSERTAGDYKLGDLNYTPCYMFNDETEWSYYRPGW